MNDLTVACDVDGVLLDFNDAIKVLAWNMGILLPRDWEPECWDISMDRQWLAAGGTRDALRDIFRTQHLGSLIGWYPDALREVRRLQALDGVRVVFATSPLDSNPQWCYHRTRTLQREFPDTPIVYTHDKTLVDADVLIDDKPEHVEAWIAKHGPRSAFLISRSYTNRWPLGALCSTLRGAVNTIEGKRL